MYYINELFSASLAGEEGKIGPGRNKPLEGHGDSVLFFCRENTSRCPFHLI